MKRLRLKRLRFVLVAMFVAAAAMLVACGGDDFVAPPPPSSHGPAKANLSHKTDVLNNIEYAYNKRDYSTYDELLDDNFTFFYTVGNGGGGTRVQWGRPDEVTTTSGLLQAADKIDLSIDWKDAHGNATAQWTEQISGSETWYYTIVSYEFMIKVGEVTYIPNLGARAYFTVRNTGTAEKPKWKLIEFRDLGRSALLNATSTATEPTTWGLVKAIYR